jgi:hypothetical protein
MMSIAWVVMSGVDCAIYVVSGAIFVAFAVVAIVAGPAPSGREVSAAKIGAAFAVVGLSRCCSLRSGSGRWGVLFDLETRVSPQSHRPVSVERESMGRHGASHFSPVER